MSEERIDAWTGRGFDYTVVYGYVVAYGPDLGRVSGIVQRVVALTLERARPGNWRDMQCRYALACESILLTVILGRLIPQSPSALYLAMTIYGSMDP